MPPGVPVKVEGGFPRQCFIFVVGYFSSTVKRGVGETVLKAGKLRNQTETFSLVGR